MEDKKPLSESIRNVINILIKHAPEKYLELKDVIDPLLDDIPTPKPSEKEITRVR